MPTRIIRRLFILPQPFPLLTGVLENGKGRKNMKNAIQQSISISTFKSGKPVTLALGFATGRQHFKDVLTTYLTAYEQTMESNRREDVRLIVLVCYDLSYRGTSREDFTALDPRTRAMIDDIYFIGLDEMDEFRRQFVREGQLNDQEAALLFGRGYSAMRNALVYLALQKKADYLLFIDDDEYPLAVTKDADGNALWQGQDILGTHLRHIGEAAITHGHHCGYVSPIPAFPYDENMKQEHFRMFIEAVSNDIVDWDTINRRLADGGVTYADSALMNQSAVKEVPEVKCAKFISGSNLCINLNYFYQGYSIPPFFNPPGARGEDSFLATCLSAHRILKVPAYAFHDGFMSCSGILKGVLPSHLDPIDTNQRSTRDRFLAASVGWVRYKPLLTYITDRSNFGNKVMKVVEQLRTAGPILADYLEEPRFADLEVEFKSYAERAAEHNREFSMARMAWLRLCRELINTRRARYGSDILFPAARIDGSGFRNNPGFGIGPNNQDNPSSSSELLLGAIS